ncbi:aldo/keto reductase [Herbiconiux sp. SYSU D00978]|uniref:aldo/keto reductase n=1 Tax=Herbiconiux sp. SYSU D00978 TaxID=2812562 RepID=UPI0027DDB13F|nr:aldo/keto reductase [Herbiconiux sp. SYSU D00978]
MTDEYTTRLGLGLAAVGRPAYITPGRDRDLGSGAHRSVDAMRRHVHELLDAAWAGGIRYLDAARSYGRAEEFLGEWLRERPGRRDELTLGSKWGYEYVGEWRLDAPVHERKEHSLAMIDRQWPQTLDALGTEPDFYLVHSVTPDSPALGDPALLARLRELGARGIRVGLSTSGPDQGAVIERALGLADTPFSVVQSTWNLLEQSAAPALAAASAAGWVVVVKEALANGRLVAADSPIASLAADDGQSPDAFAMGAVLAQPWADLVLSGAATVQQLAQNLAARPPRLAADALALLAEEPRDYWRRRSDLGWS